MQLLEEYSSSPEALFVGLQCCWLITCEFAMFFPSDIDFAMFFSSDIDFVMFSPVTLIASSRMNSVQLTVKLQCWLPTCF